MSFIILGVLWTILGLAIPKDYPQPYFYISQVPTQDFIFYKQSFPPNNTITTYVFGIDIPLK
jgi:hypothetical protein